MNVRGRPDFRKRRERDFWQPVNRLIVLLIGVGVLVLGGFAFVRELGKAEEMRARLAALERDLAAEELALLQKRREESWLKTEPEYVEALARDGLNLMKEGETVFRLDTPPPAAPADPDDFPSASDFSPAGPDPDAPPLAAPANEPAP